ncbi:MAG TPA: hypothetical protein VH092_21150, partial [Urbifossiella sp.]|nr:hypothetical protein [Urbifossiella sp.]
LVGLAWLVWLAAGGWALWFRGPETARPRPVPAGDQEIVWLFPSTSGDAWSLFVIGLKRCEMPVNGVPSGITVDDSAAFPEQSTAVPELVVERAGYAGQLRIRWYKIGGGATIAAWVEALAKRRPAPLAVIGGSTSDRAQELATALNRQAIWRGQRPIFVITTATVDTVLADPDNPDVYARVTDQRNLADVYPGRTFRFCFSNSQMVRAVTDFVLQDATLHPGPQGLPSVRAVGAAAGGVWPALAALPDAARPPTVFPLEWQDDPYSGDLYNQFREYLFEALGGPAAPPRVHRVPTFSVPFSVGAFSRPNPGEAAAIRDILARLPPDTNERSLLVLPTGSSAPARRILLALAERVPGSGRRLVALTGDGMSVNTFYRDAEWAWPARSIPIPMVLFAHANPVGWDDPTDTTPPPGYRLEPKTTTEEVFLDHTIGRTLIAAAFAPVPPGQPARLLGAADEVAAHLRVRSDKFFDDKGNRRSLGGEHVVVVRPTLRYGDTHLGRPRPDATIDVYRREDDGVSWKRAGSVLVQPPGRTKGAPE